MTFRSIAPIKPKRKNKKTRHIKLRLGKVAEYFERAASNCFTRSPRKVKNGTTFRK